MPRGLCVGQATAVVRLADIAVCAHSLLQGTAASTKRPCSNMCRLCTMRKLNALRLCPPCMTRVPPFRMSHLIRLCTTVLTY